jgi:hypothetical protein
MIALGQPLPDEPYFLIYRLLTELTEAINSPFLRWENPAMTGLAKKPFRLAIISVIMALPIQDEGLEYSSSAG